MLMTWKHICNILVFCCLLLTSQTNSGVMTLSVDTTLATQIIYRITDINLSAGLVQPTIVLVRSPDGSNKYDYIVVVADIDGSSSLSGSEEHISAIAKPANTTSVTETLQSPFAVGAYTHYKVFSYNSLTSARSELNAVPIIDRAQDAQPSGFAAVNFQDVDYSYKKARGEMRLLIDPKKISVGNQIYVCFQVSWSTKLDISTSNCVVNGSVYNGTCASSGTCQLTFSMLSSVDISTTPYLVAYQRTPEKSGDELFTSESDKAGGQVNEPIHNSSTVVFDMSANYDYVDRIVGNTEAPRKSSQYGPQLSQVGGMVKATWVTFLPSNPYTSDTPAGALGLKSAVFIGPSGMVSHPSYLDNNLDTIACSLTATGSTGSQNNVTLTTQLSFDQLRRNCSLLGSGLVLSGEMTQVIWDTATGNVELQLRAAITITFSDTTSATSSTNFTIDNIVIQHGLEQDVTTPSQITFWSPGFFRLAQKSVFVINEVMYVEHSTTANSFYMTLTRAYFADQSGEHVELNLDVSQLTNQDVPAQAGRFRFMLTTPVVMNCFDICWLHCESKLYTVSKSLKSSTSTVSPKVTQSSHALVVLDRRLGPHSSTSSSTSTAIVLTAALLVAARSLVS